MTSKYNKIHILTNSDFPYGGAAEAVVRNIAKGLLSMGAIIDICRLRGKRYSFENDTGITCKNYLFNSPFQNDFAKILELLINLFYLPIYLIRRKLIYKDQAILLYGIEYAYYLSIIVLMCRILKIKTIRIITDYYQEYMIVPVWWKKLKIFFYEWQFKHLDRYFDGILVFSSFLKNKCLQNQVDPKRLLLIPHFIEFEQEFCLPEMSNKKKIMYCGTITEENGVLDLIMAFSFLRGEFDNLELYIIGHLTTTMKDKITALKIDLEGIYFPGQLCKNEVQAYLSNADIFVNPRRSGVWADAGFPTKIGEYFSYKKPVVSTNVGDLKFYLQNKREIIFAESNSINSLSDAIRFVISHPDQSKIIAQTGYLWALEHLDYKKNSKILNQFIYEL